MKRRHFLTAPVLASMASVVEAATEDGPVIATGDGIPHSPEEYSNLLQKLSGGIQPDDYSLGGIVAKLEENVAASLGKESAVWLPTGTLANHLAVRLLAGEKRRVLVQQECHL
jgi:threonine aldolase